ncbi:MAG TPA: hypothetical protein VEF04_04880 [Blastocatellia bacterium]|nr:hypothetical protein [Blastocatellia bacterium]
MNHYQEQFAKVAQLMSGAPYQHQGRSHNGVDCIGLALFVALQAGLITQADVDSVPNDYPPQPQGAELVKALRSLLIRLPDGVPADVGDLLLIQFRGEPQHLLLVVRKTIAGPEVIHAVPIEGVSKPFRCDRNWLNGRCAKLSGVYRWKLLSE